MRRETSLVDALIRGWLRECRELKIWRRRGYEIVGDVYQKRCRSTARLSYWGWEIFRAVVLWYSSAMCVVHRHSSWTKASACCCAAAGITSTQKSAFATILSWPEIWRISGGGRSWALYDPSGRWNSGPPACDGRNSWSQISLLQLVFLSVPGSTSWRRLGHARRLAPTAGGRPHDAGWSVRDQGEWSGWLWISQESSLRQARLTSL